eukprot:GHVU01102548.1.p3 GENE.GHVU01102548.1~~GHVU01102548.1.p3  ORF type:complete len:109 (+),score=0.06 GHVU01102548.1:1117-1443(+)
MLTRAPLAHTLARMQTHTRARVRMRTVGRPAMTGQRSIRNERSDDGHIDRLRHKRDLSLLAGLPTGRDVCAHPTSAAAGLHGYRRWARARVGTLVSGWMGVRACLVCG